MFYLKFESGEMCFPVICFKEPEVTRYPVHESSKPPSVNYLYKKGVVKMKREGKGVALLDGPRKCVGEREEISNFVTICQKLLKLKFALSPF